MELYHSTNQEITKIETGRFGEFLFFAGSAYLAHGSIAYKIEIEEENLISSAQIFDQENAEQILEDEIKEVMEACSCKEQTAMSLIEESITYHELLKARLENGKLTYEEYEELIENCGEVEWDIQTIIALCAKKLGYEGVVINDEHGSSYMINMTGKESKLKRIK